MKKYLVAACLMFLAGPLMAERRDTPTGLQNSLAGSDYGGVSIATVSNSSANVLLFGNGGSIAFVHATSAPITGSGYFIIRSSVPVGKNWLTAGSQSGGGAALNASGDYSTNNEVYRVYVATTITATNASSGLGDGNGVLGWDYTFPSPIYLPNGALFKLESAVNWGSVTIGYTKFGDQ